jgi:hypothetical protein
MSDISSSSPAPAPATSSSSSSAASSTLPRFQVSEYQPDGGFAPSGVAMLISALVLIGAALGFAAHWISQFFYLIILFPAAIGLALGYVGKRMITSGRVRNPLLGGVAGFLGGAFAMLAMHYFDYEQFRGHVSQWPAELRELAQMSPVDRARELTSDIKPETRAIVEEAADMITVTSFPAYVDMQARHGVELKRAASSSSGRGLNLGYYGSYIYWLVEVLIVAGITFVFVKSEAAEPFCTDCSEWKKPTVLGFLNTNDVNQATGAVKSGDANTIVAAGATSEVTPLRLTAATCPHCAPAAAAARVDLKLELLTTDSKGNINVKTLAHSRYPGDAMAVLAPLFAPRPATTEAAQQT